MRLARKGLLRFGAMMLCGGLLCSGPASAQTVQRAVEDAFWDSVKGCTSAGEVEAYLEEFPKGRYVGAARACLVRLQGALGPPGTAFRDCPACPEMVVVPAGSFTRGSPPGEKGRLSWEYPPQRMTVPKPFAIGKYEVTRGEFARFVQETDYRQTPRRCATFEQDRWKWRPKRGWRNPEFWQDDRHPVTCVARDDIEAYLRWLSKRTGKNYRLPSETEWEYAARAGTTSSRYWGDSTEAQCGYANGADLEINEQIGVSIWPVAPCRDESAYTSRVGRYRANGFGLHDMLGNVWELAGYAMRRGRWVAGRALRGGSWFDDPGHLRVAVRLKVALPARDIGFRVALGTGCVGESVPGVC